MESSGDARINKKKCRHVTAETKLKILEAIDNGLCTVTSASLEYNLNPSTIRRWSKNRGSIRVCSHHRPQSKHIRSSPNEEINEILYNWFEEMRLRGLPVSGPTLRMKALELRDRLSDGSKFTASEGWLQKWKMKYGVRQLSIVEEKLSADMTSAERFKAELLQLIEFEDLKPCQIFNADETGLYYKLMPNKVPAARTEKNALNRLKENEDRVTVMPCCNADGSCKLPLVVIGKSAKPSVLTNVTEDLPVYYISQKNAWMSRTIFGTWFKEQFIPHVTSFLRERKLPAKVILILDNAPSHPSVDILNVGDLKAVFLPSNVTSLIQPMNQGIIANMKQQYRVLLLTSVLNSQKHNLPVTETLKSVNIKDVIFWISQAWNAVSQDTISNSWSRLLSRSLVSIINPEITQEIKTESVLNILRQVADYKDASMETVQCWLNEEDNLPPEEPSLEEIITRVQSENDDVDSEESPDEFVQEDPVTVADAEAAANCLIKFLEQSEIASKSDMITVREIQSKIIKAKLNI